jgi:hypothetical protein
MHNKTEKEPRGLLSRNYIAFAILLARLLSFGTN